jgi:hypothetical protein
VNEFGKGAGSGVSQANRDAVGKNDFGRVILVINHIDRNEGRRIGRWRVLLAMLFDPTVKTVNRAAKVAGDLGKGARRRKSERNGGSSKLSIVTDAGHDTARENDPKAGSTAKIIPESGG